MGWRQPEATRAVLSLSDASTHNEVLYDQSVELGAHKTIQKVKTSMWHTGVWMF